MLATLLLFGAGPLTAQTLSTPPFARIVYVHGGSPAGDELYARLRAFGFDGVNLPRGADPSALAAHGLGCYVDQVVGKGVLELRDPQWKAAFDAFERDRGRDALIRPSCLADPAVRSGLARELERNLAVLGDYRPFAVCLADEASTTRHSNPFDFCFGPHCLAKFRDFLRARYPQLPRLEAAWGERLAEWDAVLPWTTDRIRARELAGDALPRNLTPWSDHLEFRDELLREVVDELIERVGAQLPGVPVGLTGLQPISAFGGSGDTGALVRRHTFWEAYDIAGTREVAADHVPRGARGFATLFPPPAGAPAGWVEAQLGAMLVQGLDGVVVWSSGELFGADASDGYADEVARGFASIEPLIAHCAGATTVADPIWIVESPASVRAHWMIDSAGDGRTWPRRFGSHERAHGTSLAARLSWLRLLQDLGLQPRFVRAADLPAALRTDGRPQVVILPATLALADLEIAALTSFVEQGGSLVADHGAAWYDERLRLRERPGLDELFGIRRETPRRELPGARDGHVPAAQRCGLGLAVAEPEVRATLAEPVRTDAQRAAFVQCERRVGAGRTAYLNLVVWEYARLRLAPDSIEACRNLRARVTSLLVAAGVAPRVLAFGAGLPTCLQSAHLRGTDGRRLLALRVHALDDLALLRELVERGPRHVRLRWPSPVGLTDLRSGVDLGVAAEFELRLGATGVELFAVRDAGEDGR